jgi:hypothetical protein
VVEFTRESIHVGEPLSEIADAGAVAVVPSLCLVEARPFIADLDRLDLLTRHAAVAVMGVEADQWRALAAAYETVGRLDAAAAALAAIDSESWVLTRYPGLYAGIRGRDLVIPIGE